MDRDRLISYLSQLFMSFFLFPFFLMQAKIPYFSSTRKTKVSYKPLRSPRTPKPKGNPSQTAPPHDDQITPPQILSTSVLSFPCLLNCLPPPPDRILKLMKARIFSLLPSTYTSGDVSSSFPSRGQIKRQIRIEKKPPAITSDR